MVQAHGHAVGVVATNDEVLALCFNFKAVDGVSKSFKDNAL